MKFKTLSGDVNWAQYGGKFVSKKLNNGDFDYWLVIEVINWHEATGDESQPLYNVSICAVSPDAAGEENLNRALGSCGIEYAESKDTLVQVEALSDYGIQAYLWNKSGDNIRKLMKKARNEARKIEMLFGFYMDAEENRIGSTGWDFIAGNLVFRS